MPAIPKSTNMPAIYTWGKKIVEDLNLVAARRQFTFDFPLDSTTPNNVIIDFINTNLGITDFNLDEIAIIHKKIDKPGLKWHIDDCVINVRKDKPTYNVDQYILLESNLGSNLESNLGTNLETNLEKERYKYLYFNTPTKRLPRYTILFYCSTYNKDFTGGKLCLSDGMEILPKKGNGILIDAREVHMVTPVKTGERNVVVVKIY
jgi:hypothetical protein